MKRHLLSSALILAILPIATAAMADAVTPTSGGGSLYCGAPCVPAPFTIARPNTDRGVFVSQIGDDNDADVTSSQPEQFASVEQQGEGHSATIGQSGAGDHYANVVQSGQGNELGLDQAGGAGHVALLGQHGTSNSMLVSQTGQLSDGVIASQTGNYNTMSLDQSGDNNQAQLTQDGDNNAMTAVQLGADNRLIWTQIGNGNPDLNITQTGGQALMITQSK